MGGFDLLYDRFLAAELAALGLSRASAAVLQPVAVLAAGDDAALWAWFDALPRPGPIYAPTGARFFSAYAAVIGALVPSGSPLDPVAAAQKRLADWGTAPPTWSGGHAGMSAALAAAPSLAFPFDAQPAPQPQAWGLLGGDQGPGAVFADGAVRAHVAGTHVLTFAPQPGDWYVSSALGLAYRTPGAAPWNPASPVTWQTAFGSNGTLSHMLAALVVVSGLAVSAASTACFGATDRARVIAGASGGMWPYYPPPAAATTTPTFDAQGRLALEIESPRQTAIALAAVVETAAAYLGA